MAAEDTNARQKRIYEERKSQGLCGSCGRKPAPSRKLCQVCIDRKNKWYKANKKRVHKNNKAYTAKVKHEAFVAYGGYVCSCCGEDHREFLTIDHINGDGAAHRRAIGRGGQPLYVWLKKNNYPAGFRVLCMNCNFAIGIRGYCPHNRRK